MSSLVKDTSVHPESPKIFQPHSQKNGAGAPFVIARLDVCVRRLLLPVGDISSRRDLASSRQLQTPIYTGDSECTRGYRPLPPSSLPSPPLLPLSLCTRGERKNCSRVTSQRSLVLKASVRVYIVRLCTM